MADITLKDTTKDRYHSIAINPYWKLDKIRSATALVVGVGALGNEVCKNLAMIGVKTIYVLDMDKVEVANLSRSVFFRETDHGAFKTKVIAKRIADLNPDVEVRTLTGDLDACLGLGLLRKMDLVFSCLDSRIARRSLNRMCQKVGKPWVDGAMENLVGNVSVYVPGVGACYECGLSLSQLADLSHDSCRLRSLEQLATGKVPTTPTMGSIVAALQVQEGLKILDGVPPYAESAGVFIYLNCHINDYTVIRRVVRSDCQAHFRFGRISPASEFTSQTTPRDVLTHFYRETNERGRLELGREVIIGSRCPRCHSLSLPKYPVPSSPSEMPRCSDADCVKEFPIIETTHTVHEDNFYADWPLERLGVPALDIIEVQGSNTKKWYELAGDAGSRNQEAMEEGKSDTPSATKSASSKLVPLQQTSQIDGITDDHSANLEHRRVSS